MDEHLTYKIEEVYGDQLSSYLYSIYFNLYTISIDDLADAFRNVGELIGKKLCEFANTLAEAINHLLDAVDNNDNNNDNNNDINKNKRMLPVKCIKPIHKAPVYKIIPYVRNRC